jgi:hypothetical protein
MNKLYPILLLLLISSCISTEKAARKATKDEEAAKYTNGLIKAKYPLVSSSDCAEWYPIKEKIVTKRDTVKTLVTVPGDSIPCPPVKDEKTGKVYTPKVKCPDVSYFQEQITELTEKTQESTAKVETANLTINRLAADTTAKAATIKQTQQQAADYKAERNKAYWALGIVAVVIGGFIVLKFLKPF